jgi:hypothetical protein
MLINELARQIEELRKLTPKVDTSNPLYFDPKYAGANRGYPPHPSQVKMDEIDRLLVSAKRQRMEAITR